MQTQLNADYPSKQLFRDQKIRGKGDSGIGIGMRGIFVGCTAGLLLLVFGVRGEKSNEEVELEEKAESWNLVVIVTLLAVCIFATYLVVSSKIKCAPLSPLYTFSESYLPLPGLSS